MLSEFNQGSRRFPMPILRCCARHAYFGFFQVASLAALLALIVGATLPAQGQDQTQQNQPQSSSSSSSQTRQQTLETRRGLESRRALTKQRREAQLVTETYTHRWEVYVGGQYMRFRPGPNLHNSGMGGWSLGFTRYFTPRFGITADARGYNGNNSLGAVNGGGFNTYNAKFSVFPFTIGPQYRFYGTSKFSVSGAVQAGIIYGYFDKNTGPFPPELVGFYPASVVGAAITSVDFDYNLSTSLAIRVAPHILFDHFGGNYDHNQGLLVGVVYRFGRQ